MLERVVRLLATVARPIVVVAAPGQELPPLSMEVLIVRDEREARGPLEGLLAGLSVVSPHADTAYATSCDVPLLSPDFVQAVAQRLGEHDIAVPVEGEFAHPLAAVYRTTVLPHIKELLAANRLRPAFLFDRVKTLRIPVAELRSADPQLATLRNLNHPDDYLAALAEAGFAPEAAVLAVLDKPST
jgi:molybdopterin-guanine dinucleotide biosynthesis protein A